MRPVKLLKTDLDDQVMAKVLQTSHPALGHWALACAERVLAYFEAARPADPRPRQAITGCQLWLDGQLRVGPARQLAVAAHAAAREAADFPAAQAAARSAGHAAATAHVGTHAVAAALYAVTCLWLANPPETRQALVRAERQWQWERLNQLSPDF